jgi:hypothetical protein
MTLRQSNHILELLEIVIDKKMITTQTAMDLIAMQCGGPDTINVYCEGLILHNALFN